MFCKNCGIEVDNSAKFCNNCGSPITAEQPIVESTPQPAVPQYNEPQPTVPQYNAPQYNEPQSAVPQYNEPQSAVPQYNAPQYNNSVPYNPVPNTPAQPAKKGGKGCLIAIIIAVVILAFFVILGIIGYNAAKDVITDDSAFSLDSFDSKDTTNSTPSAEYTAVFNDNNIIVTPSVFIGLDSRAFAMESSDGMIENMEFAYKNDTIKELIDTIYYPISEYDAEYIDLLDDAMREGFASAEAIECCTVTYDITDDFYIIKIHSTELDNSKNLKALSDAEVITYDGFAMSLSMEDTASALTSQGYAER